MDGDGSIDLQVVHIVGDQLRVIVTLLVDGGVQVDGSQFCGLGLGASVPRPDIACRASGLHALTVLIDPIASAVDKSTLAPDEDRSIRATGDCRRSIGSCLACGRC